MSFSLAQDFLGVLSTYATAIILVLIVFVLLGAVRGWVSGLGSAWGLVGVAALFVLLGIYALWAAQTTIGALLVGIGILVLVLDALSDRRHSRSARVAGRR